MKHDLDWDLIISCLEGDQNSEQEQLFNSWLISDELNKQMLEKLQRIWNSPDLLLPKPDREGAWHKFIQNINLEEESFQENQQPNLKRTKTVFLQQVWNFRPLRIAAAILIIVAVSLFITEYKEPTPLTEILVPTAQKMILTLSDGSKVTLDAESIFRYPEKFGSERREVYLSGEGYFEVSPNGKTPFTVHVDHAMVTVLGTKFNVRSWKHDLQDSVTVTVVEGRVSLQSAKADHRKVKVTITEGQSSGLVENKYPSTPQYTDISQSISWLNREMYFQKVPMRNVLEQLERWYGYEIVLPDSSMYSNKVTIFIENKPIEENLKIISLMVDMPFRKKGKTFIFSKMN